MNLALIAAIVLCLIVSAIVLLLTAVGLTLAGVYAHSKIKYWQGKTESAIAAHVDVTTRLLVSESHRERIDRDYFHLKNAVEQLLQRPILATLNDQQATQLIQTVAELVSANKIVSRGGLN